MRLSGLHLLLTYQCTFECDHCFVWGSPSQSGTMTVTDIERILQQAAELGSVKRIYFEGGEPFLYYATLLMGVRQAVKNGFEVGIVTNSYWALGMEDALENLRPFKGKVHDLSISSDLFHYDEKHSLQAENAAAAAERLGMPAGVICVEKPEEQDAGAVGQIPIGDSDVMFRGRAAEKLAPQARMQNWRQFTACPHEELREPGRVHVDPFGNLHLCQGICIGNLFRTPLVEICERYEPDAHPIIGPLLEGGPAGLAGHYNLPHAEAYADACHLCYEMRRVLRPQFPEILGPDQVYGVY